MQRIYVKLYNTEKIFKKSSNLFYRSIATETNRKAYNTYSYFTTSKRIVLVAVFNNTNVYEFILLIQPRKIACQMTERFRGDSQGTFFLYVQKRKSTLNNIFVIYIVVCKQNCVCGLSVAYKAIYENVVMG